MRGSPGGAYTPPEVDTSRGNRSPGISTNFYDMSTADRRTDFKRSRTARAGPLTLAVSPHCHLQLLRRERAAVRLQRGDLKLASSDAHTEALPPARRPRHVCGLVHRHVSERLSCWDPAADLLAVHLTPLRGWQAARGGWARVGRGLPSDRADPGLALQRHPARHHQVDRWREAWRVRTGKMLQRTSRARLPCPAVASLAQA